MQQIEQKLDELLVKKAPYQLPEHAKKTLVSLLPWLALVGGILTLIGAWWAYQAVATVAQWSEAVNSISRAYGYADPMAAYGPLLWVSLALLVLEAILFFFAFPALQARKKSGWNLLLYVSLINLIYAIVYVFANSQQLVSFIFSLLFSVLGLYLLFQIRSYYLASGAPTQTPPAIPPTPTNSSDNSPTPPSA